MATIEKMQPRPFKRKFLTPFAAPNTLWKQNTAVAASRRYSLNEFKKAWEIYPNDSGADRKADAQLIIRMSFQLAIPWRVALQQARLRFTSYPILVQVRSNSGDIFFRKDCFEN